jgi:hypothetical protein
MLNHITEIEKYWDAAHETADTVYQCVISAQDKIFIIHGNLADCENAKTLPIFTGKLDTTASYYLPKGQPVTISFDINGISLILSGLDHNVINIDNKINHLIIRKSYNSAINIKEGTVSGLDLLHCHNMVIKTPKHNFTNLEYNETIKLYALVDDISQLHISGSMDIWVNDIKLQINPFIDAVFKQNKWTHKDPNLIPDIMILNR